MQTPSQQKRMKKPKNKFCYNVVLDLVFGDNTKGRVVDWLCGLSHNPLVTRFNGGHQAGHKVYYKNLVHVFSNFGSGTLRGVPTYWSKNCTLDPVGLVAEYTTLLSKGVQPKLFISPESPIATPLDIEANRSVESINRHGSVGIGFGTTIQREEDHYKFKFLDIFHEDILAYKIEMVKKYYELLDIEADWLNFMGVCKALKHTLNENIKLCIDPITEKFDSYIYESAQGLLLDQHKGFFPHVTRSNTGLTNLSHLNMDETTVWLLTRAYQTRHGNGPMTNERHKNNCYIQPNPYESNKTEHWQGEFRTSILDLSLLEYSFTSHNLWDIPNRRLVISCLDNLKKFCLTHENKDYVFKKETDFINMISEILRTPQVYVSKSPGPESIYKF